MKILVDTSVWSLALRKKTLIENEKEIVKELKELIIESRVVTMGPIRQELLSGISNREKFNILKEKLKTFDDIVIKQQDYELAAEISNLCRTNGIQGSHTDFLICSVTINNHMSIFTTDKDFNYYKKFVDIKLHNIRDEI